MTTLLRETISLVWYVVCSIIILDISDSANAAEQIMALTITAMSH
jgi:hypothetical protein